MKRVPKILYPALTFLAIYFVIYFSGMPRWEARLLMTALVVFSANGWILWKGIDPKTQMMNPDPKFDKNRRRHELEIRIVVLAFGLATMFLLTLPLMFDLVGVGRGQLIRITNAVALHEVGSTSDWSIYQSVEFSNQGKVEAYTFFFFPERTKAGVAYDFVALPHSHIILDCHESRAARFVGDPRSK